ncbi:MAG TPA: hypothetical protein VHW72_01305 [Candidatus Angelobacter sp.]|jgi:hypothetical protein|nr:hypothetical protein [Candidatus Angelobacter sp.]
MKAATLLAVLCFPLLLSSQQALPMNIPAPPDHPGQKLLMVSHRDLLLFQMQAWIAGYQAAEELYCRARPEMKADPDACARVRIEAETGSDDETCRLHAYFPETGDKVKDPLFKSEADLYAVIFKAQFESKSPKWLKWERRDNAGPTVALK